MCNNIINTQCPEKGTTIFLPVTSSKLLQRQTGKKSYTSFSGCGV